MKRPHFQALCSSVLFLSVSESNASTIISDAFTAANGTSLIGRVPDTNNGAAGAVWQSPTTIWQTDIQGNRASLGADTYSNIDISSSGSYIQPQRMRLSATVDLGNTGGPLVPNGTEPTRGIGLGFYSGVGANIFTNTNFRGLVLTTDGRLVFGQTGANSSPRVGTLQNIATGLNNSGTHTLSFDIDTVSGDISNILLNGNLQPDVTTTLFNSGVNRAGFFASSSAGNTRAYFDDFSLTAIVIPEPSTVTLAGLGAFFLLRRRR